jgi:UDP-glucuronate 4-epimerase
MMQPVLITGVAGFIGSHLAQRLIDSGYSVVGLDNFDDYYPVALKKRNLKRLEQEKKFQIIEGDIRDIRLLNQIFNQYRFSSVLHLAARAGVRPSVEHPLLYQDVNVMGTLNLLQACRDQGINKFIFASSSSVYGISNTSPFHEDASINYPASPYAASKAAAELFCRTYNHLYKVPMVVLRLFTVYGPRQRPEMAIHHFVRQISTRQTVKVFGDGSTNRDYTCIEDIVDGFIAAMNYKEESFQIFNLGSGRTVELRYLISVIEKELNQKAQIQFTDPVPGDVPITFADISRARSLLGYQPKISIEEGIGRFIRWYQDNKE